MIIHESIKNVDRNILSISFFSYCQQINMFFFITFFFVHRFDNSFFITKTTNVEIFWNFVNVSNFDWKFYIFQIKPFSKSLSAFVIRADRWSSGFKYQTKHHLKYSLSSILLILINFFLGPSNYFGNLL